MRNKLSFLSLRFPGRALPRLQKPPPHFPHPPYCRGGWRQSKTISGCSQDLERQVDVPGRDKSKIKLREVAGYWTQVTEKDAIPTYAQPHNHCCYLHFRWDRFRYNPYLPLSNHIVSRGRGEKTIIVPSLCSDKRQSLEACIINGFL